MSSFEPARYTCYRASGPISIDGKLDEPSWLAAPKSTAFVDIVTGQSAWFDTRVALLWDDDNLYFGFWAEENDVWGTLTERDSKIYEENDLEVFIAGQDAYYEFEINALNTVYEVFWIWKDKFLPGTKYFGRPEFDPATHWRGGTWCARIPSSGIQTVEGDVNSLRFETVRDYDDWLGRMHNFPAYMDHNIDLMREGIKDHSCYPR